MGVCEGVGLFGVCRSLGVLLYAHHMLYPYDMTFLDTSKHLTTYCEKDEYVIQVDQYQSCLFARDSEHGLERDREVTKLV